MALTYIGETEFVQSGPPQWQQSAWDLDTLTIPYSGSQPNLDSFLNNLEKGSPADIDGDMYLMDWRISGTKAYPQVDLVYIGKKNGEMPPKKTIKGGQIASATTNTDSTIWPRFVTNPATVQFYAVTNTLSYYSTDKNDASEPDDPPEITGVVSWDFGFGLQPGFSYPDLVTYLLTSAFVQGIIEMPPDIEPIVDGQIYRIVKRKTRTLFPYAPPS